MRHSSGTPGSWLWASRSRRLIAGGALAALAAAGPLSGNVVIMAVGAGTIMLVAGFVAGALLASRGAERTPVSGSPGASPAFETSERDWLRAEVQYRARHDPLTGLPNRAMFNDQLASALSHAPGGVVVAVLDIDHFKAVNNGLGHEVGDTVIAEFGHRLATHFAPGSTAGRVGGDEFALLLPTGDIGEAQRLVQEVLAVLEEPFMVGERAVFTRVSVGIAHATAGDSAQELLRKACVAVNASKERGKRNWVLFDPQRHMAAVEELALEVDLENGLARGEFVLSYQPIVDLDTGTPVSVEALLRWEHPQRGTLKPDVFVPLAERSGLIVPLGRWVIEQACRQLVTFDAPWLSLSINLSALQFEHPSLVDDIEQALQATGLDPHRLTLEVTESLVLRHSESTSTMLRRLRAQGVSLAIDDFGTGYSSFASLRERMIDVVKIDRSFIEGVARGPEESALAHAIVKLAHSLGMRTVAEGIEDVEQVDRLRGWSCEYGQGFYYAPPMAPDLVRTFLGRYAPDGHTELIGPRTT